LRRQAATAAIELASCGIGVDAVAPDFIATPMFDRTRAGAFARVYRT
jgi:NAD(P)-dependent dehydrogenase (short-subunit alcohol dehydrogenase family)